MNTTDSNFEAVPNGRPFWMVWCPTGGMPRYRHDSEDSAHREAQRLARDKPGRVFVVLQSVSAYLAKDLQVIDLCPPSDTIPY